MSDFATVAHAVDFSSRSVSSVIAFCAAAALPCTVDSLATASASFSPSRTLGSSDSSHFLTRAMIFLAFALLPYLLNSIPIMDSTISAFELVLNSFIQLTTLMAIGAYFFTKASFAVTTDLIHSHTEELTFLILSQVFIINICLMI